MCSHLVRPCDGDLDRHQTVDRGDEGGAIGVHGDCRSPLICARKIWSVQPEHSGQLRRFGSYDLAELMYGQFGAVV